MSFSMDVKEELSRHDPGKFHCRQAEAAAIMTMCGSVHISVGDRYSIRVQTENVAVARRISNLFKKHFKAKTEVLIRRQSTAKKTKVYIVMVKEHEDARRIAKSLTEEKLELKPCCMRAYIKGAFLAAGSVSDPNNSYHFEIACDCEERAEEIKKILEKFQIDAKWVARKKNFVVYIKEGSAIVDALNVMGAHVALMNLENVRIVKDMRNNLNRQVNCETANISKIVKTACKQIDDINYIIAKKGLDSLSPTLQEMAIVRLENPDTPLQELGVMLSKPIGKSGVNHRLRKLGEIAQSLRDNE